MEQNEKSVDGLTLYESEQGQWAELCASRVEPPSANGRPEPHPEKYINTFNHPRSGLARCFSSVSISLYPVLIPHNTPPPPRFVLECIESYQQHIYPGDKASEKLLREKIKFHTLGEYTGFIRSCSVMVPEPFCYNGRPIFDLCHLCGSRLNCKQ